MLTEPMSSLKTEGASYREFSRRRYRELKAQTSNLRESEIIARVIRQWDSMKLLNVQQASTPLKEEMLMGKGKTNQKTTGDKKVQKSEMMRSPESQEMDVINVRDFDEESPKQMKTKPISHAKNGNNNEYISFFKSYFAKISNEHPNWTAKQITSIIKLLWKKRKNSQTQPTKPAKQEKPMSGRTAFRKTKDLSSDLAAKMWKKLPMESRKLWQMKGNSSEETETKMNTRKSMRIILKLSQQNSSQTHKIMDQKKLLNMRMM